MSTKARLQRLEAARGNTAMADVSDEHLELMIELLRLRIEAPDSDELRAFEASLPVGDRHWTEALEGMTKRIARRGDGRVDAFH